MTTMTTDGVGAGSRRARRRGRKANIGPHAQLRQQQQREAALEAQLAAYREAEQRRRIGAKMRRAGQDYEDKQLTASEEKAT